MIQYDTSQHMHMHGAVSKHTTWRVGSFVRTLHRLLEVICCAASRVFKTCFSSLVTAEFWWPYLLMIVMSILCHNRLLGAIPGCMTLCAIVPMCTCTSCVPVTNHLSARAHHGCATDIGIPFFASPLSMPLGIHRSTMACQSQR